MGLLLGLPLLAAAATTVTGPPAPPTEAAQPILPPTDFGPLVDAMFDDAGVGETRAVVVVQDGAIVAERYAPGYAADQRFISWSMAKSVTAILVGFLVEDGTLDLDAPAPIPEWHDADDPRRAITLRELLQMSSGLEHTEVGDPIWDSDTNRMLFVRGSDDMAAYAVAHPLEAQPGTQYEYSSSTSVILARIIADALTDSRDPGERAGAFRRFAEQRLTGPADLPSLYFEFDARGTQIGGSFMHATARDWAKIGELLRTGRNAAGRQVISPQWRAFMLTPSPLNPEYGGHIWLNRAGGRYDSPTLFPGTGPDTIFSLVGHLGQYVTVSPAQRRTVVRLGNTPDGDRRAVVDRLGRFFAG